MKIKIGFQNLCMGNGHWTCIFASRSRNPTRHSSLGRGQFSVPSFAVQHDSRRLLLLPSRGRQCKLAVGSRCRTMLSVFLLFNMTSSGRRFQHVHNAHCTLVHTVISVILLVFDGQNLRGCRRERPCMIRRSCYDGRDL